MPKRKHTAVVPPAGGETITLSNGLTMPALGFGCAFGNWTNETADFMGFEPEKAWSAIPAALRAGYRHLDGAYVYATGRHMGDILGRQFADGALRREDVWVTTKLAHPVPTGRVSIPSQKTVDLNAPWDTPGALRSRIDDDMFCALAELGVGWVDCLLMHWPGAFNSLESREENARKRREIWSAFEHFYEDKKIARSIGVSNFTQEHLESLRVGEDGGCSVMPQLNQIELHPYCQQKELTAYCKDKGIAVVGYAPFGSGSLGLLQDETLGELAKKHKRDVGQIILRWGIQQGYAMLPKSSSEKRMKSNLRIFDFELSPEDMDAIGKLDRNARSCADPGALVG